MVEAIQGTFSSVIGVKAKVSKSLCGWGNDRDGIENIEESSILFRNITIFAHQKMKNMEYGQNDNTPPMACEAALAYNPIIPSATISELEQECLPLEESKRLVLEMVHHHFRPET